MHKNHNACIQRTKHAHFRHNKLCIPALPTQHYAAYNLEKWGPDGPGGKLVDRHHFNAVVSDQVTR
jgi:hypothetical protein